MPEPALQREDEESDIFSLNPIAEYQLDESVLDSFPEPGTRFLSSQTYGESLWGRCEKLRVELPSGEHADYFLKGKKITRSMSLTLQMIIAGCDAGHHRTRYVSRGIRVAQGDLQC